MKVSMILPILGLCFTLGLPWAVRADIAEVIRLQAKLVNGKRPLDLAMRLQRDHGLSDADLQALRARGLDDRQITIAARFAKASRKPINEIVKMRVDEKKGWGRIADDLGVDPKDIGLKITRKVHWQIRPKNA